MGTALAIMTNMGSITAQKNVGATGRGIQKSIERLSSGLRLVSAADDAAGMAVSTDFEHSYAAINKLNETRTTV